MARKVEADQLVGAAEIAERLGVTKQMVHHWRARKLGFPEPIVALRQALVWNWPDVEEWARSTGHPRR